MKFQTHIILAASAITLFQPWKDGMAVTFVAYFLGILGGLLPDVDHPGSFIGSKVPIIPTILFKFSGHRGVTHSLFGLVFATILGVVIVRTSIPALLLIIEKFGFSISEKLSMTALDGNRLALFSLGIGYLTHMIGDIVTNRGIPVFWPVPERYVFPITNTGSMTEKIISLSVVALTFLAIAGVNFAKV